MVFYVAGDMLGVRPEMAPVFVIVPEVFHQRGLTCVLTSCVRPDPHSFHGYGLAVDWDSHEEVDPDEGAEIAARCADHLGRDYTCLWHKTFGSDWHLHIEFDPGRQGLEKFLARGLQPGVSPPPAPGGVTTRVS